MQSMAANDADGIISNSVGKVNTDISNNIPWYIADICVFAFALILAELLTITMVIGRPPIRPEIALPIP